MNLFSHLLKRNKNKYIAIGAIGAAFGVRVLKGMKPKKVSIGNTVENKRNNVASRITKKLSSASSFASYFSEEGKYPLLGDSASTTPVEDAMGWVTEAGKSYIVLLFDVDSSMVDATDKQARSDFFKLMGNLTSNAVEKNETVQMLYVPGKNNNNLLEGKNAQDVIGKAQWKYLFQEGLKGLRCGGSIAPKVRREAR